MTTEQQSDWLQRAQALVGREYGRVFAWDPVNEPMIRHWCEAMGIENPLYLDSGFAAASRHGGAVAPPTMLQVWLMAGLNGKAPPGSSGENPYEVLGILDEAGFQAVVAVNSEQEYERYLRPGDRLYRTSLIESISEEKSTALGVGYFVTELMTFFDQHDAKVGSMRFRLFKYRPHPQPKAEAGPEAGGLEKPRRPRPGISQDTQFFWDGLQQQKLLIQRCSACGAMRHPPGPVCPECHSFEWDTVQASGKATLYSFVVMHHPEVPPFDYPNPIGLVELEEGTRLVAGLAGVAPKDIRIGMPLQLEFEQGDPELILPVFRPMAE